MGVLVVFLHTRARADARAQTGGEVVKRAQTAIGAICSALQERLRAIEAAVAKQRYVGTLCLLCTCATIVSVLLRALVAVQLEGTLEMRNRVSLALTKTQGEQRDDPSEDVDILAECAQLNAVRA